MLGFGGVTNKPEIINWEISGIELKTKIESLHNLCDLDILLM